MIDLHAHFLYGVDDGPARIEDSFELLRQAEQAGISKILATPHVTEHTTPRAEEKIKQVFEEIKNGLAERHLQIEIHLAAEVYYSPKMIGWAEHPWLLIGSGQPYMLFDLPMQFIPADISEIIFQLIRKKVTPIMAHPERNVEVQKEPHLPADWVRLGCLMQMDAGSITGEFGRVCQRTAQELIRNGYIHLVASDAHDRIERNFHLLANACTRVKKKHGSHWANLLFNDNPLRILNGEKVILPTPINPGSNVNFIQKISGRLKSGN